MNDEKLMFSENWAQILGQDEFWYGNHGSQVRVADMEPSYCANVHAFILRSLPRLAERDSLLMLSGPGPSGDMAQDAFDGELGMLEHIASDPASFAARSPLMQALKRRIDGLDIQREDAVADTYELIPQTVRAFQYTGDNFDDLVAWVNSRSHLLKETMMSGPGPCRGMQKAVTVQHVGNAAAVPIRGWLLFGEDGEDDFWALEDHIFKKKYRSIPPVVKAEIICYCGHAQKSDDDPQHALCWPGPGME